MVGQTENKSQEKNELSEWKRRNRRIEKRIEEKNRRRKKEVKGTHVSSQPTVTYLPTNSPVGFW